MSDTTRAPEPTVAEPVRRSVMRLLRVGSDLLAHLRATLGAHPAEPMPARRLTNPLAGLIARSRALLSGRAHLPRRGRPPATPRPQSHTAPPDQHSDAAQAEVGALISGLRRACADVPIGEFLRALRSHLEIRQAELLAIDAALLAAQTPPAPEPPPAPPAGRCQSPGTTTTILPQRRLIPAAPPRRAPASPPTARMPRPPAPD